MGDLDKTYTCKNCKVVFDPTEPYAGGSTKYCCGLCREEHLDQRLAEVPERSVVEGSL